MQSIGMKLTAGLTLPLLGAGGLALKTAADYETLRQSMDILNGSTEEGARNFERLKKFSARTPFQLKDLAEAQNMLQGFSLSADEAFESMSMIGDIAAVTGGDIKGIGIAFGQAAAEGRLMTRDIRQLINQGVPAIQLLADTMGVATSEVLDLASEGKISFDILRQAFRDATTEGGMFANGMRKQANTLAGIWSTLKDNVSIALGGLGDSISEAFNIKAVAKNVIVQVKRITSAFQSMSSESQRQILSIAAAIGAGGPLLVALGVAAKAVSGFVRLVTSKFTLITAAVASVVVTAQWLSDNWSTMLDTMGQQLESWARATSNIFSLVAKTMSFFGRGMGGAMAPYFAGMDAAIMQLQGLGQDASQNFSSFQEAGVNAFNNVAGQIRSFLNTLSGGSLNEFLTMLSSMPPVVDSTSNSVMGLNINFQLLSNLLNGTLIPILNRTQTEAEEAENSISRVGGEKGNVTGLASAFGNLAGKIASGKKEALNFGNILSSLIPAALSAIPGLGAVGTFASSLFGGFRAHGGSVSSGKSYVVGERGPELFTPGQSGQITPSGRMGGTKTVHLNITGSLRGEGSDLRAVIDESKFIDLG